MGIIDKITGRFRKSSGGGESLDVSQQGYPEEAPPGTEAGGETPAEETPQRQGADTGTEHPAEAVEHDDGKATGNPRSAG
jgi:hypothetical protein